MYSYPYRYTFLLLCLLASSVVHGQDTDSLGHIRKALARETTFAYYELADSFAKKKDSVHSSEYFLKVNPFLLLYKGVDIDDIDSVCKRMRLTSEARHKYKGVYAVTYWSPITQPYADFRKMHEEDIAVRAKLDKCNDSFSCAMYEKQVYKTDSIHSVYLYQYIQKHGWPTLENGSLYAATVAMHDYADYSVHMQVVKKAVLQGLIPASVYNAMVDYEKEQNDDLHKRLRWPNKVVIDVSNLLKYKELSDETKQKISDTIKAHCPILHVMFLIESNDRKDEQVYWNEVILKSGKHYGIHKYLIGDKLNNCFSGDGIYFKHLKKPGKMKRMKLYLLY